MPATLFECALFSKMATNNESKVLASLSVDEQLAHHDRASELTKAGWRPLPTSEELGIRDHGYYGVAYYKPKPDGSIELAFAHRGTFFNEMGNILANIAITEKNEPAIVRECALRYVEAVRALPEIRPPHKIAEITHTGFSLGGFIAGACAALSPADNVYAVAFDNPGIGHLRFDRPAKVGRIRNVLTRPNLVNTCNPHVGEVLQVINFPPPSQELKEDDELSFEFHLGDCGMSPAPRPCLTDTSPAGKARWQTELKEWEESEKKREIRKAGAIEAGGTLFKTLDSHNLDKIINAARIRYTDDIRDLRLLREIRTKKVYAWPLAENEVLRDTKFTASPIVHFGKDGIVTKFVTVVAVTFQAIKDLKSKELWDVTQRLDPMRRGVVGIKHRLQYSRVLYTAAEEVGYHFVRALAKILIIAAKYNLVSERAEATRLENNARDVIVDMVKILIKYDAEQKQQASVTTTLPDVKSSVSAVPVARPAVAVPMIPGSALKLGQMGITPVKPDVRLKPSERKPSYDSVPVDKVHFSEALSGKTHHP